MNISNNFCVGADFMKNVLITGATSGIGETTARYLAGIGYNVTLVARNEEKLQMLCHEFGKNSCYYVCDLANLEEIAEIFKFSKEKGIVYNGLVHCAGIGGAAPIRSLNYDETQKIMTVNCFSFVEMAKYIVNRKYGTEKASLIAISSLSSKTCYAGMAAYSMSKEALNVACKVLSKEVLNRRIRVNTIMPANVRTPMTAGVPEDEIVKQQAWGFVDPLEIAYLVEFLLSDKSVNITGADIPVSAGMFF